MKILVLNAGSSSLKYQLIEMRDKSVIAKGILERIGIEGGRFKHSTADGRKFTVEMELPDHNVAFKHMMDTLLKGDYAVLKTPDEIGAIGHRIVNGGEKFVNSVLVTDEVLKGFQEVINFAPLHNPPALAVINACRGLFGKKMPNVLVFDTSFHQTMPPYAYIYPVQYKYYEKYGLRKYGAHGTSHRYVSGRCAEILGRPLSELRIITCHIGNGSSISAVQYGKCIDTSMGFTPLAGIMMGTRSGSLDPSVVTFLMEKEHLTPEQMENELNKKSGLLGIVGYSSDSRDLEEKFLKTGDKISKLAIDMMNYQIKKYVGAYTAAMGGLDALVFTAGIGENSDITRRAVCDNMELFGIRIDDKLNRSHKRGTELDITAPGAKVRTLVIPTNEELMIAQDTQEIVSKL